MTHKQNYLDFNRLSRAGGNTAPVLVMHKAAGSPTTALGDDGGIFVF